MNTGSITLLICPDIQSCPPPEIFFSFSNPPRAFQLPSSNELVMLSYCGQHIRSNKAKQDYMASEQNYATLFE